MPMDVCRRTGRCVTWPFTRLAYLLRYLISASRLSLSCKKRRLDIYNFNSNDPQKNGFLPPQMERDLEYPQAADHLVKVADEAFVYGVNTSGDTLVVSFARFQDRACEAWVYLRTHDGRSFSTSDVLHMDRTTDDVFRGGGLSISCLSPMRRWRFAYNGALTQLDTGKPHHVKFGFMWTALSGVYDYAWDVSPHLIAKSVANRPWTKFMSKSSRIKARQDTYEQCGQMRGVLSINGEKEREIYLWGSRIRNREEKTFWVGAHTEHYFGYTKEGLLFHSICEYPLESPEFFHGFVFEPDSVLYPLKRCAVSEKKSEGEISDMVRLRLKAARKYSLDLKHHTNHVRSKHEGSLRFTLRGSEVHFGNEQGYGISLICRREPEVNHTLPGKILYPPSNGEHSNAVILRIGDPGSEERAISGGKGASLVTLSAISAKIGNFSVPRGIIVTTAAYRSFIAAHQQRIDEILSTARTSSPSSLKEKGENIEKMLSSLGLSADLRESLRIQLEDLFEDFNAVSLAVRSSSVDEDGEGASSAGQMTTFLCVQGLDQICKSVVKCWASQFSFESIQYKIQHGQDLNTPMAVVVQEMAESEVSGVIFTCDPVTGNPLKLVVNANYGLGESVVGSTVEPDTLILERDLIDGLKVSSTVVGTKTSKITKGEDGTAQTMAVDSLQSGVCCISEAEVLSLGNVALSVLEHYGTPLDIEFAFNGGRIFLLQARPVTSLFRESDFELIHENDFPMKTDREALARGNFGEVLPIAASPLFYSVYLGNLNYLIKNLTTRVMMPFTVTSPYFMTGFVSSAGYYFMNVSDSSGSFNLDDSLMSRIMIKSLSAEDMDLNGVREQIKRRNVIPKSRSMLNSARLFSKIFWGYAAELERREKKFQGRPFLMDPSKSSQEIFENIFNFLSTPSEGQDMLAQCCAVAFGYGAIILILLAKSKGDLTPDVFTEQANLLAGCDEVESMDVSKVLQSLAHVILQTPDAQKFLEMTEEEALAWLTADESEVGDKFRNFLKSHGHRCVQDMDLYSVTWGQDPKPLVKMLQALAKTSLTCKNTQQGNVQENQSASGIRLGAFHRFFVRFSLPRAKKGIVLRERGKSLYLKQMHELRLAFTTLGEKLVEEGKLSDPRLVFFLTLEEVDFLIKKKSDILLMKAARRKKLHEYMNNIQYPNILIGIPKSLHETKLEDAEDGSNQHTVATGIPVCQGLARGKAKVIVNPADIPTIEEGDILIARTTDTAWTPYFPLLKGVVTEIGGVLSHGAVVAREYGIPCLVSVARATKFFLTGEMVEVDSYTGTIRKVTFIESEET